MLSQFIAEGISQTEDYFGIVEFYDAEFDEKGGRGRVKAYLGEDTKYLSCFKIIEVFEKGIKHSVEKTIKGKPLILENELVKFKISMGPYGFQASDLIVLCLSAKKTDAEFKELMRRFTKNKTSYGYAAHSKVREYMHHVHIPESDIPPVEEKLPKIIRVSREVEYEQKT